MKILPQRGAIPITLGDPARERILFFDMAATWILVEKYGVGFLAELYTVVPNPLNPVKAKLGLKSLDALKFFLWAGLQAEISLTEETLSLAEVEEFLRPWTFQPIFNAVVMAVTGAVATPALPKAPADGVPATPPARRAAGPRLSTLPKRSASSAGG
jgi:hypothetical protein